MFYVTVKTLWLQSTWSSYFHEAHLIFAAFAQWTQDEKLVCEGILQRPCLWLGLTLLTRRLRKWNGRKIRGFTHICKEQFWMAQRCFQDSFQWPSRVCRLDDIHESWKEAAVQNMRRIGRLREGEITNEVAAVTVT